MPVVKCVKCENLQFWAPWRNELGELECNVCGEKLVEMTDENWKKIERDTLDPDETGWRVMTSDKRGNVRIRATEPPDFKNHTCGVCKETFPNSELVWDRPPSTDNEHPYPTNASCPKCGTHCVHVDHFPP